MKKQEFKGVFCVPVTVFKDDESIDEERTKAHIDRVIKAGVHGIVIGGSTSEFASLSDKEREYLLEFGIKHVKGRVPLIAGAMAPSTRETIRWSKFAKDLGADGLMIVNPYYGQVTDEALYQHFKAVADAVDLPIIPYNNVAFSGNDLTPEIICKLAENTDNIRYVKECVGSTRIQEIIKGSKGKMNVFVGSEDVPFQGYLLGAKGIINGQSNIFPELAVKLYKLVVEEKDIDAARELWYKLLPIALLCDTPGTWLANIKAACEILGDSVGKPRRPVLPATEETKEKMRGMLKELDYYKI